MARHIGIVACSTEGAALCYRTISAEAAPLMGEHMHPPISLHSHPLGTYMPAIRNGDWANVARLMLDSARRLAQIGAELAICPDNTIHQAFGLVEPDSPIPWLHIGRVVAQAASARGFRAVGVLGTKYLMEGPVYPDALAPAGVEALTPSADERQRIDDIIFGQLVYGQFPEQSRLYFNEVIEGLAVRGAQAAVLGCTEIPLLVRPDDCPLPTLDSTRLLARAALHEALA